MSKLTAAEIFHLRGPDWCPGLAYPRRSRTAHSLLKELFLRPSQKTDVNGDQPAVEAHGACAGSCSSAAAAYPEEQASHIRSWSFATSVAARQVQSQGCPTYGTAKHLTPHYGWKLPRVRQRGSRVTSVGSRDDKPDQLREGAELNTENA
ncbi:hypothetical protein K458DRAFT_407176 [Lentithecium fluviatile CBS 122367]|uniref:Uncharacterized protein n=1 Tax=Lentithecium fluviatile CBS 122367 TaxID=1168545 RepID=A0A6G1IR29_9PLEO|nr:hypothetical protein K458DRAFT_407176 [Lentithecium fluviatile CBS 122367]